MLTRWAKRVLQAAMGVTNYGSTMQYGQLLPTNNYGNTADIEVKAWNGNTYYINGINSTMSKTLVNSLGVTHNGFAFGSGNSAESEDSYTLDSIISSGISASFAESDEKDMASNKRMHHINITVTNNGGSEITIKEVGIFNYPIGTATTRGSTVITSSSYKHDILIDRTVLASPVTIAPGASALIRYTFEYDIS